MFVGVISSYYDQATWKNEYIRVLTVMDVLIPGVPMLCLYGSGNLKGVYL